MFASSLCLPFSSLWLKYSPSLPHSPSISFWPSSTHPPPHLTILTISSLTSLYPSSSSSPHNPTQHILPNNFLPFQLYSGWRTWFPKGSWLTLLWWPPERVHATGRRGGEGGGGGWRRKTGNKKHQNRTSYKKITCFGEMLCPVRVLVTCRASRSTSWIYHQIRVFIPKFSYYFSSSSFFFQGVYSRRYHLLSLFNHKRLISI